VERWARGRPVRDVYVYFDNDYRAYAPQDAAALHARLRAPEVARPA
jgi:uncharacterized protein YecE (DUF72 family)